MQSDQQELEAPKQNSAMTRKMVRQPATIIITTKTMGWSYQASVFSKQQSCVDVPQNNVVIDAGSKVIPSLWIISYLVSVASCEPLVFVYHGEWRPWLVENA